MKKFPNVSQVERSYEVIQETGDVIFVPSGWHHQVHNLEDTISINHNWFNGANIGSIFSELKRGIPGCLIVLIRQLSFSAEGCVNPSSRNVGLSTADSASFTHPLERN